MLGQGARRGDPDQEGPGTAQALETRKQRACQQGVVGSGSCSVRRKLCPHDRGLRTPALPREAGLGAEPAGGEHVNHLVGYT